MLPQVSDTASKIPPDQLPTTILKRYLAGELEAPPAPRFSAAQFIQLTKAERAAAKRLRIMARWRRARWNNRTTHIGTSLTARVVEWLLPWKVHDYPGIDRGLMDIVGSGHTRPAIRSWLKLSAKTGKTLEPPLTAKQRLAEAMQERVVAGQELLLKLKAEIEQELSDRANGKYRPRIEKVKHNLPQYRRAKRVETVEPPAIEMPAPATIETIAPVDQAPEAARLPRAREI